MPSRIPELLLVGEPSGGNPWLDLLPPAQLRSGWAASWDAARTRIEEAPPDWVVLVRPEPLDQGLQFCRWLRTQTLPWHVTLTVLLDTSQDTPIVDWLEAGADDCWTVAVPVDEIRIRLRNACRRLESQVRLVESARIDWLTGVLSGRGFREELAREWQRYRRHRRPCCIAMLDLDWFKPINDLHGHAAGDRMLQRVASVLRENCRASDVVGRLGGDEFGVLLPETTLAAAEAWSERVRQRIESLTHSEGAAIVRSTVSMGIAAFEPRDDFPEQALERADQALLRAKHQGRNRAQTRPGTPTNPDGPP